MTVNPDDAFTWSWGTTDGEDALAERIEAKLIVRGLRFGEDADQDSAWNEAIAMMARWKAMNVLLHADDERSDYDRQRNANVRGRVMAELFVVGLWIGPWIEVAREEFPGIEFDQAKVDEYIAELPERVERHDRLEHISIPQPADMAAFLEDRGYKLQQTDHDLLLSLSIQSLARQFMAAVMGVDEDEADPGNIFRQIFDRASQPRNGVWVAFFEHFYLGKRDEES